MTAFTINLKWGRQEFKGIELDCEKPQIVFRSKIYSLTGVPIENQRIMTKGGILKATDTDLENAGAAAARTMWSKYKVAPNQTWMMMGTAPEKLAATQRPVTQPVFIEDTIKGTDVHHGAPGTGLVNLGNTCFLASVVQGLRATPQITKIIKRTANNSLSSSSSSSHELKNDPTDPFLKELGRLLANLDDGEQKRVSSITPTLFVAMFRSKFPHLATQKSSESKNEMMLQVGRSWQQQDADECWQALMATLGHLKTKDAGTHESIIDAYFGIQAECETKCKENGDPRVETRPERYTMLHMNINNQTNHLRDAICGTLSGELTKYSTALERDCVFTTKTRLTRLPQYLVLEFVRFFWKPKEQVRAKILRAVSFPMQLDMYEHCHTGLQARLQKFRAPDAVANCFEDDLGSNNNGLYDLNAVLTHQGRSADAGHYILWRRREPGSREWLKYDDNVVSVVPEEDILKLVGIGDWHIAYILIYGPRAHTP